MSKRLTWEQIVKDYPNKWVALTDCEYASQEDNVSIVKAIVVKVGNMEEIDDFRIANVGKAYKYRCTTEDSLSGVIYGENIKVAIR